MQEEAAEKFDGIFEASENENSEQYVSKMLAKMRIYDVGRTGLEPVTP